MNQPFATDHRYTWRQAVTWLLLGLVVLPAAGGRSCRRETITPAERPGIHPKTADLICHAVSH